MTRLRILFVNENVDLNRAIVEHWQRELGDVTQVQTYAAAAGEILKGMKYDLVISELAIPSGKGASQYLAGSPTYQDYSEIRERLLGLNLYYQFTTRHLPQAVTVFFTSRRISKPFMELGLPYFTMPCAVETVTEGIGRLMSAHPA